jgi:C4-dicarboxylate-specific signal transduction histidine kinase
MQKDDPARHAHDLRPMLLGAASHCEGLRLDIQVPDEPVPVLAVETELRELLAQVAAHAARVMRAGARLQVSARTEGRQAVVHWRDLDAADVRPPLAMFFDNSLAALSGAGAKVCALIAARHGGRIYPAPHAGGVLGLTLRLPLLPANPPIMDKR